MKGKPQFGTWTEALAALCQKCEEHEVSLIFRYDPGWSSKRIDGGWAEPELNEGERGYSIEVGGVSFAADGGQAIYEKPSHAVHDGWRLFKEGGGK